MILIDVKKLIMLMISHNNYHYDLKKVGKSSRMSCAMFRTGLRAPHVVLAGALVPAGTVLVTPAVDGGLERYME